MNEAQPWPRRDPYFYDPANQMPPEIATDSTEQIENTSAKRWERVANNWNEERKGLEKEIDRLLQELEKQKAITAMWEKVADKWRILSFVSMIVLGVGFIAIGLLSAAIGPWF